ncbi:MAG: type 2 lanthipeptide synthetase LanM, partial [Xenococcaceae cyanobacterium]
MLTTDRSTLNLRSIVAKASTLTERLHDSSVTDLDDKDKAQIEERLQRWCQVVAKSDLAKFKQRLAWSGLDIEIVRPLLVDRQKNEDRDLPLWTKTLEKVINTAQNLSDRQRFSPRRYFSLEDRVPFEPVYIPCLEVALKKLLDIASNRISLLTEEAQIDLEKNLVQQLNEICIQTLMEEFSKFRSTGNDLQDFLLFRVAGKNSQEKYHAFIDRLFEDGLISLFEEYSVLGKLVAKAIDLWVETTAEFIDRLATDWSQIEGRFAEGKTLKQVVAIKPGLSDPHNGRRFVMTFSFDTGMQLVYKPKDLSLDVAFYKLLHWCNLNTDFLPLKVLQVLNYDTHGWIEYVELLPCQSEVEAQHFYQRAGMLLCLIHCLGGTDCHHGNLIANGEQPILIDTETLVHPHPKIEESQNFAVVSTEASRLAQKRL